MLRRRTWQGMDRIDSLTVAVFGAIVAYAAVRGGTLLAEELSLARVTTDATAIDLAVVGAWVGTVVVTVAGTAVGTAFALWGVRRALGRTAEPAPALVADGPGRRS